MSESNITNQAGEPFEPPPFDPGVLRQWQEGVARHFVLFFPGVARKIEPEDDCPPPLIVEEKK